MKRRQLPLFWLALVLVAGSAWAAEESVGDDPSKAFFAIDRVWRVELEIPAENWRAMLPTQGLNFLGAPEFAEKGTATPKAPDDPNERPERRGGFKFDFRYVRARAVIDGETFPDVGVRFKGNSSYGAVGQTPKRPFKIDFDRYVEGRTIRGLKMLNLTNNAFEPSQIRESLAYAAFRAAGVPAPRTAFAELYLTVPDQFDHQFVGLYTLIEQVDRTFLNRHFADKGGMLLKPEGFQGLPYLGNRWEPYADFYRPKNDPDASSKRRLMELTRLISYGTDEEFEQSLDGVMDVDNFLRYLAVCSAALNLDSFVGFGHNYYLYLNPADGRFVWIPWDLNGTFGGLGLAGPNERQVHWSVEAPYVGYNRLVARVLAVPRWRDLYRQHVRSFLDTACNPEILYPLVDRMRTAIQDPLERESKLPKPELPAAWKFLMALGEKPPDLKEFVARRATAMRAQLDENKPGKELSLAFAVSPERDALSKQIAKPLFRFVDANRDRALNLDEIVGALQKLHERSVATADTPVDESELAVGIVSIFPKPSGLFAKLAPTPRPQPAGFGAGNLLAGYLGYLGNDQPAPYAREAWSDVAQRLLARADKNTDGQLDEAEVVAGLNWLPPPPLAFDPAADQKKPE